MKKIFFIPLLLVLITSSFFSPFFLHSKVPIPADTIIGLYHPFRDFYAKNYPNGIPYKNFLVTDPVRQQYPWRSFAITQEKNANLPLWNPYTMAGTPLLATLQGGVFYPLNLLFFILPFSLSWSLLIILQPVLAGLFLYFYLQNLRLTKPASLFGALAFSFSGFSVAWLEWGTIGHVALWLPLVLLSIDKLLLNKKKEKINRRQIIIWSALFVFSLTAAFFAGHLQTFFYLAILSSCYFFARLSQIKQKQKKLILFLALTLCIFTITAIQWIPTLKLIGESARDVDFNWHKEGWFIPWQHLAQFIVPDFFGNPATLNYWGVWNYGEMVGYIGIIPLLFSFTALFWRHDKKTYFYASFFVLSLLFALPTFLGQLPFILHLPFISTTQPTRLLFLTDFSLSVLAALGIDFFMKNPKKKQLLSVIALMVLLFGLVWSVVFFAWKYFPNVTLGNMLIAKRNLYFPTIILLIATVLLVATIIVKNSKLRQIIIIALLLISVFDLFRFMNKFTPFSDSSYLYPNTKILSYLQNQTGEFRIMTTDPQIMPPNFSTMYKLQTIDGYDPLYLKRYGEFVSAINRNAPNIEPPFGFNRIIQSIPIDSPYLDLLGVKYILSFSELPKGKFTKIMSEGKTILYENKQVAPRAFFVNTIQPASDKKEAIKKMFEKNINLRGTAIVEGWNNSETSFATGSATITSYSQNHIEVTTSTATAGFLVLTDTFYPTWHASICSADDKTCQDTKLYRTDYNFRGVLVPAGTHYVVFSISLL